MSEEEIEKAPRHFIQQIIDGDNASGKHDGRVVTRFPPEPNGYLHIGHAKSICLNFGTAIEFDGTCHLRFDDTNPAKEDVEYVESIQEDVRWLGFDWGDNKFYTSNYFEQLFEYAVQLIKNGKAFVCDLNADEVREHRGTLTEAGENSPFRDRSIEENLALFIEMKEGKFEDGSKTLRAKIDMSAPNMNMRDPAIYRIRRAHHHNTGDDWCIYPMYDYAHCLSDSIEKITHSLCTLEFEDHRPLYDWVLEALETPARPQQIEFARLNLTYTVMSKRKLLQLVESNTVNGWDDPRMPTISGIRRRGYTSVAVKNFCDKIGIAKRENTIELPLLESCLREDLNKRANRVMAVLNPLKVVIENYPEDGEDELPAVNNPEDESAGKRIVPFSKVIYIEKEDFMEDAPKKFFRLAPGREVRLRYAFFITCTDVIKDENGEITELRCTYDPETRGGNAPDGRRVKGTLHWVSDKHALDAEVRIYENLFTEENPEANGKDFMDCLNPDSLKVIQAKVEPSLHNTKNEDFFQFERLGYFSTDKDSSPEKLVFNRSVSLKDSWGKKQKKK